jgi:outer membrane lipoprotein-sorting protein
MRVSLTISFASSYCTPRRNEYVTAGSLGWLNPDYTSTRQTYFSAEADDCAESVKTLFESAGFEPTRAGKGTQLPPNQSSAWTDWIGPPVEGVEYKWTDSPNEYRNRNALSQLFERDCGSAQDGAIPRYVRAIHVVWTTGDIIVSNGTTTTIYDAGNNTVRTLNTSFGGMGEMNQTGYVDTIERTLTQSNVSYEGTATVAGEETFVLSVTPNTTGNATTGNQTYYLSQESYLPVKTVSESSFTFGNETTTTRSTTLLRDLQVNVGLSDSLFEFDAPEDAERLGGFTPSISTYDSVEQVQQNTNFTVCEPSEVPDGYSFENATVTTINNNTSVGLQYTNGSGDPINDSLSVSISTTQSGQQANASEFGQNVSIDGQSGTYVEAGGSGIVTFTTDDLRYTITGPFSQDELISIAESIDCATDGATPDGEDGATGDSEDSDLGQNDEDDDGDGHVDEDGEDGNDVPSNDDDDGDGAIDEDDELDDGDDGSDDFDGNAEDDDDGDGHYDEDDEQDGGNSDDEDNDGDGAIDEDDEPDTDD